MHKIGQSGGFLGRLLGPLKMKQKNKNKVFRSILLGTLGASLLGNLSTGEEQLEQVKIFDAAPSFN